MALETLKDLEQCQGFKIINMDKLKEQYPDKFNKETGQMNYKWFEKEIRPNNFIYVRDDVNSLSFTIQNGPVKENGVNGCQVTTIIGVACHMIEKLNERFPCEENQRTIKALHEALSAQEDRTIDRIKRNVEGLNQK